MNPQAVNNLSIDCAIIVKKIDIATIDLRSGSEAHGSQHAATCNVTDRSSAPALSST